MWDAALQKVDCQKYLDFDHILGHYLLNYRERKKRRTYPPRSNLKIIKSFN